MDLSDYSIYVIKMEFDQSLTTWIDQDSTRITGKRRVVGTFRVIAKNGHLAIEYMKESLGTDRNPEFVSIDREQITGIVYTQSLQATNDIVPVEEKPKLAMELTQ